MAVNAKKTKSTKIRVSKKAKKNTDKKLFIALGVLVVVIIAVAGIAYYRQSQASNVSRLYPDFVVNQECRGSNCVLILQSSGRWNRSIPYPSSFPNGQERFVRINNNGTITCANIKPENRFKLTAPSPKNWVNGEKVIVTEVYDCFPSN